MWYYDSSHITSLHLHKRVQSKHRPESGIIVTKLECKI